MCTIEPYMYTHLRHNVWPRRSGQVVKRVADN